MTLEEIFEALMKNYEEERLQNEYLRKQLGQSMRAHIRNLHDTPSSIPSESNHEDEEEESNPFSSFTEEDHARSSRTVSKILKLKSRNLKDIWTSINSLNGSKLLKGCLSTRMYLKTRR